MLRWPRCSKKRDKDFAQLQDELAGAQAKAVQLAVENRKLKEQVPFNSVIPCQTKPRRKIPSEMSVSACLIQPLPT